MGSAGMGWGVQGRDGVCKDGLGSQDEVGA